MTLEEVRLEVAKIYAAAFDRAPDAAGLTYWAEQVNSGALTIEQVAQSFFDQPEFEELYHPTLKTDEEFVSDIYNHVFDRAPSSEEVAYWVEQLQADNAVDRTTLIAAMVHGAQGDDAVQLENQAKVGVQYALYGAGTVEEAKAAIEGVTADPATVEEALNSIENQEESGQIFTTTYQLDTIVGTSGDDVVKTDWLELGDSIDGGNGNDTLEVYGGVDIEKADITNIENVDIVTSYDGDYSYTLDYVEGLEKVSYVSRAATPGKVTLTTKENAQSVSVTNAGGAEITDNGNNDTLKEVSLKEMSDETIVKSDALVKLNLSNMDTNVGVKAQAGTRTLTVSLDKVTGGTVKDAEATALHVETSGNASKDVKFYTDKAKTVEITANASLSDAKIQDAALKTLTVDGSAAVSLAEVQAADLEKVVVEDSAGLTADLSSLSKVVTVDLSATSGNNKLTVKGDLENLAIKGGSGNDDISAVGALDKTARVDLGAGDDAFRGDSAPDDDARVDGGAGNDILGVTKADQMKADVYTNFEILDLAKAEAGTYDMSTLPGLKDVLFSDAENGAVVVSKLANEATVTFDAASGADTTYGSNGIELKLADTQANDDTITFKMVADDAVTNKDGTAQGQADVTVTANGIENVNIESTAVADLGDAENNISALSSANYTNKITLTDDAAKTLTISGDAKAEVSVASGSVVKTVDASQNGAGVTVDMTNNSEAVAFLGSDQADTYTASGQADKIEAHAGNDTITLAAGEETVRYVSAQDANLVIKDTNNDGTVDSVSLEKIENFTTQADKIELSAALNLASGDARSAITDKGTVDSISDAVKMKEFVDNNANDFFSDGTTDRAVAFVTDGTDSVLFVDANADGNLTLTDDLAVELAGIASINDIDIHDIVFG